MNIMLSTAPVMVSQCFILLQADKVIVIFSGASFFNGNWTEWSAIWAEIICMISKLNECTAQVQFEITSIRFWTKIAQHEVQLPLYYIHFEIAQIQDLVSSNILLMQYWAGLKLNSSIFGGEDKSFGNKSCKICHMILFVFHFFCNLISNLIC